MTLPIPSAADLSAPALPGRFVTVAVLLLASMTIMSNATIAPSLPGLRAHFGATPGIETLSGLILTLPSLSIVLAAGLFGWMADRFDRRPLLIVAALLFAAGGASGLVAQTLPQMLVGRSILGIGVAGTMTLALVWGADLWQGQARARFLGLQGASLSAGGIVVMLLGGVLASLHWRGAFAVYLLAVPIALVAMVALAPYNARRQARAAEPVAQGVFPWGTFAFVGPLAFFFMATFYMMPTRLPFRLGDIGVHNTIVIGAVMACFTLAALPGSLNYGRMRQHMSAMAVFALSYGLMAVGFGVIALATGVGGTVVGVLIAGLGMGPSMPNYSTYFMGIVPPALRGRASGLLTTAFFAGQFASPLVSAPLVARFGLPGGFAALAVMLAAVALGLALAASRGSQRDVLA